jgi:hypothetical protein
MRGWDLLRRTYFFLQYMPTNRRLLVIQRYWVQHKRMPMSDLFIIYSLSTLSVTVLA